MHTYVGGGSRNRMTRRCPRACPRPDPRCLAPQACEVSGKIVRQRVNLLSTCNTLRHTATYATHRDTLTTTCSGKGLEKPQSCEIARWFVGKKKGGGVRTSVPGRVKWWGIFGGRRVGYDVCCGMFIVMSYKVLLQKKH